MGTRTPGPSFLCSFPSPFSTRGTECRGAGTESGGRLPDHKAKAKPAPSRRCERKKKKYMALSCLFWGRTSCCPVTSTPIKGVRCDGSISLAVAVRQLWTEKIHHPIGGKRDRDSLGPSFSPTVQDLGVTQWLLGQWQPARPSWGRRAAGGPGEMDGKRG